MDKHVIKWGSEEWDRLLSPTEKEELLKEIDSKAKGTDVFYINVLPGAVAFLQETLMNAHIIRVIEPKDNDGKVFIIISGHTKSWK